MNYENGWDEYKMLVLHRLDETSRDLKDLSEQIRDLRVDVDRLKVRASVWGMVAGGVVAVSSQALQIFFH